MSSVITGSEIESGLRKLGITTGMALEVHCSLSKFGHVDGGAITIINALKNVLGNDGTIVMPSFLLSPNLPLNDIDRALGLTAKIKILRDDNERSAMGIVSDTFRKMPDVITGQGIFRVSAWGKDAGKHSLGFRRLLDSNGGALLLGVDIYRLSSMHYVEDSLPVEIRKKFEPSEAARELYPEDQWLIEAWEPSTKPWYTIQNKAYEKGFIKGGMIGDCKCMLLKVRDVVELYRWALQTDPFGLYGMTEG